jgi:hypothetical protein
MTPRIFRSKSSPRDRWRAELQMWAISRLASTWLIDVEPYEPTRVAGVIERIGVDPVAGWVEVTINDGTAVLAARWRLNQAQQLVAELRHRALVLEGIPKVGENGDLIMEEPMFEAVPPPDYMRVG